ncbi:enoyl-CoA hydratase/isomerase family protein [Pseudalkalibacillus sp. SCS-8]|uniref:enoyl-CoA hydratase/isomerase family protein n=1 Tax=Pseudalkalibacillus nanhaiensis TaxID=3115291 RepID=UPI0032DA4E6D
MAKNKLLVEVKDGIGWITLNHAERYNAINYEMMDLLDDAINQLEYDDNAKVLVITGSGDKAFCSGGDLSVFHQLYSEEEAFTMLSKMGNILYKLFKFPKPTVALMNGVAVGGGCEIATACDFRVAAPHVKFGFIQGTLGITTGWGGATFLMERIGKSGALELLMRPIKFSAEEGRQRGFIHEIVGYDQLDGFEQWIQPMTKVSANVLKAYKQRWLDHVEIDQTKEKIKQEIEECARLWASEEHHQAVQSFLDRS